MSGSGSRTAKTTPASASSPAASAAISAPAAAKSASVIPAWAPAPASTATVGPSAASRFTVSGVAATRVSNGRRSFRTASRIDRFPFVIASLTCAMARWRASEQWGANGARMGEVGCARARRPSIRRACARLCLRLGWAPLHEVTLPNGRRADILALRQDGGFACIEVKSGVARLPAGREVAGVWRVLRCALLRRGRRLSAGAAARANRLDRRRRIGGGDPARDAPRHPLPPARRRALLQRFAWLAAGRLARPKTRRRCAELRAALRGD